jgi:transcriptional regulator with XRE-family HTH domain
MALPAAKTKNAEQALGDRLKALRLRLGLSLRALADRSGVTYGALSHIENGRSSPSVSTLKKVLAAMDTTMGEFFSAEDDDEQQRRERRFVFRARDLVNVLGRGDMKYLSLPGQARERALQLMWEIYPPGKGTGSDDYVHAGQEGGFCVKGTIELVVDGRRELLGPGDAYYFDSTLPHSFRNVGETPAIVVSACTPPSF